MPYTLSHPAAVLPLGRPLGRWGFMSALVIGSMAPDFPYWLGWTGLPVLVQTTHKLPGALTHGVPLALSVYLLYELAMRRPLLTLLPAPVAARLQRGPRGVLAYLVGVPVSLALGVLTHVVWDGCTHEEGLVVQAVPALQTQVLEGENYRVGLFRMIQHTSTVLGATVLAAYALWWLRRQGLLRRETFRLPARQGLCVAVMALSIPATVVAAGLSLIRWPLEHSSLRFGIYRMGGTSVIAVGVALLSYSLAWHAARLARRRRPAASIATQAGALQDALSPQGAGETP